MQYAYPDKLLLYIKIRHLTKIVNLNHRYDKNCHQFTKIVIGRLAWDLFYDAACIYRLI